MIRRDLLTGHWKPYLERAISLKPCYEGGINGGEVNFSLLKFYVSILGKEFIEKDKFSSIKFLVEHFLSTYKLWISFDQKSLRNPNLIEFWLKKKKTSPESWLRAIFNEQGWAY